MEYGDYIGNVTRVAVELANQGGVTDPSALMRQMFDEHGIGLPETGNGTGTATGSVELGRLPGLVRVALGELVGQNEHSEPGDRNDVSDRGDRSGLDAVTTLIRTYPPDLHLSEHDGTWHIHYARDGSSAEQWLGRTIAAALAHVAAGDPGVTLGLCAAGCGRYFVDQSRNRTRRFCKNSCASRTTVAAYRARQKEG